MTMTRRGFCERAVLAMAAAALEEEARAAGAGGDSQSGLSAGVVGRMANEEIAHAIIGCRIRGRAHAEAFGRLPSVRVTHVCDPDRALARELAQQVERSSGQRPVVETDLRRVFGDAGVDTVSICTPNHWHALATLWALQAGKDVYVEKPLSHTIEEGQRMVAAVARSGRVCQVGTQNRSHRGIRQASEYVRSGRLGEVTLARTLVYGRRAPIGGPGSFALPPELDYNLWLGPGSGEHRDRPQLHYDWHWVWDTGNGELGNNNIHYVDLVRWVTGLQGPGEGVWSVGGRQGEPDAGQTPNTQMVVHRFGKVAVIQEVRGLPTKPFSETLKEGWIVYGTEGIVSGATRFDLNGQKIETFVGGLEDHFANFIDCVRRRAPDEVAAPVSEGHASTALCHLGNISQRVGEVLPVGEIERRLAAWAWHPAIEETFRGMLAHLAENQVDLERTPLTCGPVLEVTPEYRLVDHWEANRLLRRSYRAGFELPE